MSDCPRVIFPDSNQNINACLDSSGTVGINLNDSHDELISILQDECCHQDIDITVTQPGMVGIDLTESFGGLISINYSGGNEGSCKVLYDTTEHWDSKPDLIGKLGYIYIYSDWGTSPDGRKVAGFKVGDGETLLADIIFTDQMYDDHIKNAIIHITQEERNRWNNKVSCSYVEEFQKIIFFK